MRVFSCFAFAIAALLPAAPACAQARAPASPTAIVEEVEPGIGAEAFDFLRPGAVLRLDPGKRIVLGYVRSCFRETITGGTVTIGTLRSEVADGTVRVECDGGRLRLTPAQASTSATVIFRDPKVGDTSLPASQLTLHGRAPLVELPRAAPLTIERLDAAEPALKIAVRAADLARGRFLDLATRGVALAPGGLYRAESGGRSVVFRVASTASPAPSPLLGRLLRL